MVSFVSSYAILLPGCPATCGILRGMGSVGVVIGGGGARVALSTDMSCCVRVWDEGAVGGRIGDAAGRPCRR